MIGTWVAFSIGLAAGFAAGYMATRSRHAQRPPTTGYVAGWSDCVDGVVPDAQRIMIDVDYYQGYEDCEYMLVLKDKARQARPPLT